MPDPGRELGGVIEIAPQFELTGPYRDLPGMEDFTKSCVEGWRSLGPFPAERTLTTKDREFIRRIGSAVVDIGKGLGIDVSSRLLPQDGYHLFDSRKQFLKAYGLPPGEPEISGRWRIDGGIFVLRPSPTYPTVTHETVHSVASIRLRPIVREQDGGYVVERFVLGAGYAEEPRVTPSFGGIDEFATEIVTDKALQAAGYEAIPPWTRGHLPMDILGSVVIEEAARVHSLQPGQVEDSFVYGLFSDNREGLHLLEDALGPERTALFRGLTSQETFESIREATRHLGLPKAASELEKYDENKPFEVFPWRPSVFRPR